MPVSKKKQIANWGLYPSIQSHVYEPSAESELAAILEKGYPLIARGNGRSYGDASLNDTVISTLGLDRILAFDRQQGMLTCESGVLLSQILDIIVPDGYFLAVTPGTKFISVGGAVASNVHGKNHHQEGSFCDYVEWISLLLENGETITCSRNLDPQLFRETCGGMGLTGVITKVCFRLKRVESAYIRQHTIKSSCFEETIEYLNRYHDATYSVAWIDCLATGDALGKGLVMLGEHAKAGELPPSYTREPLQIKKKLKLNVPFPLPYWILNRFTVKVFNFLYYNKVRKQESSTIVAYDDFFYPLDSIGNWNRIYGRKGFLQYQFVIPMKNNKNVLKKILSEIAASGQPSFLAVLKLFGNETPYASLNFPMKGYTLALDFKVRETVWPLLEKLDQLVVEAGGRLYLTKDARMSRATFQKTYPQPFQHKQDTFTSIQSQRLGITKGNCKMTQKLLIIGGTSDLGLQMAFAFAARYQSNLELTLAGRDAVELEKNKNLIESRYPAKVVLRHFDATDARSVDSFATGIDPQINTCIYTIGYLGQDGTVSANNQEVRKILEANFTSAVCVLNNIAKNMTDNNIPGVIAGVSSVAGDRGRQSNFLYGSAKAGFTQYLGGLRNLLYPKGVHVLTVIPGYMETKMTIAMTTPAFLTTQPGDAAKMICKAIDKRKNVVYISPIWYWVMLVIKNIPEFLFKKLKL